MIKCRLTLLNVAATTVLGTRPSASSPLPARRRPVRVLSLFTSQGCESARRRTGCSANSNKEPTLIAMTNADYRDYLAGRMLALADGNRQRAYARVRGDRGRVYPANDYQWRRTGFGQRSRPGRTRHRSDPPGHNPVDLVYSG